MKCLTTELVEDWEAEAALDNKTHCSDDETSVDTNTRRSRHNVYGLRAPLCVSAFKNPYGQRDLPALGQDLLLDQRERHRDEDQAEEQVGAAGDQL